MLSRGVDPKQQDPEQQQRKHMAQIAEKVVRLLLIPLRADGIEIAFFRTLVMTGTPSNKWDARSTEATEIMVTTATTQIIEFLTGLRSRIG